jgi:hypothetical protein
MCDRIRYFAEECDTVAGFHVHVDVDSGFAGIAYQILNWIREEYPNQPVCTISCWPVPPLSHFSLSYY